MSMFIRSLASNLRSISSQAVRSYCQEPKSSVSRKPVISTKEYPDEKNFYQKPREVWLENMDTIADKKLGLVTLHPEIFAASPRIDVIQENIRWQRMYRFVSYAKTKTRAEVRGGGKKPWPQKGSGRARHGSIRSPIWKGGGRAHGPRGPKTHFYMLPFFKRVAGLASTLSVKLAQDDLHIVDTLDIPAPDSSFIQEVINTRNWGPSVLFVDTDDIMPKNISLATDEVKHVNLMPVYGLNVYSMLKHDTLVLTERAARLIEEKLLYHIHRSDDQKKNRKFKVSQ